VLDPVTMGPCMPEVVTDLPASAKRFKQKENGVNATIVNGKIWLRNNEHTGALPGKLLRGPWCVVEERGRNEHEYQD